MLAAVAIPSVNELMADDFAPDQSAPMIEGTGGGPDIAAAVAELRARGVNTTPPINARNDSGVSLPPEAFQGVRPLQRALQVKQLQGQLGIQDAVNELMRRGVKVKLANADTRDSAVIASQKKEAQDVLDLIDPSTRAKALSRIENEKLESAYVQAVGDLPEQFDELQNVQPASFEEWYQSEVAPRNLARINSFQGSDVQRAQFSNQLDAATQNSPMIQEKYRQYITDTKARRVSIPKGTPEYYDKIRSELTGRALKNAGDAARIKALPGILEAQAKAEAEGPQKAMQAESDIRKEIQSNDTLKRFREQMSAASTVNSLATKPNPTNADDLSLIYAYVKLLDPGSVVREGEIKLTQQATPALQKLLMQYNRLFSDSGGLLDSNTRQNYLEAAQAVEHSSREAVRPEFEKYKKIAQERGISLDKIFNAEELSRISGATAAPTATPATSAAAPSKNLSSLVGKQVRLKNGKTGIVIQKPDGTFGLQ